MEGFFFLIYVVKYNYVWFLINYEGYVFKVFFCGFYSLG